MHDLATTKAGSLGDELYIANSRFVNTEWFFCWSVTCYGPRPSRMSLGASPFGPVRARAWARTKT